MLAIRMQRTGRSGHAQFRVIVQDSHFHPTRGKVVAYLGSYNPHLKTAAIDKELASKYLDNGAQPSDRVAKLLKSEGVKLPDWVSISPPKESKIKNPEKMRRNRPAGAPAADQPAPEAAEAAETTPAEASEAVKPEEDAAPEQPAGSEVPAEEVAPAPGAAAPAKEQPAEPTDAA